MITSIKGGKVDIFSWCYHLEEDCLKQAQNLSSHPQIFKHLALMPDAHLGFGMPIGTVAALKDAISPNMVGVDIGCGMMAVQTSLMEIAQKEIKEILKIIRKVIPLGFKHHPKKKAPSSQYRPKIEKKLHIVNQEKENILPQLGTLGGGNHFIEIQKGSDGYIWFMLHSGSRNLGLKVAQHYNQVARNINIKSKNPIPPEWQLDHLMIDSSKGQEYLDEMKYCLSFAQSNRQMMAQGIKGAFSDITGASFLKEVNIHHNYAAIETHFGEKVVVHRKGATRAYQDELGLIPGSQGTPSYIISGLGNLNSFMSCSHGAGRCMGRKEAIRKLNLTKEASKLDEKGIIHSIRGKGSLDEAPSAYKDIEEVMNSQKDLVKIITKLSPLAVIKG